jgi:hypothetical protein
MRVRVGLGFVWMLGAFAGCAADAEEPRATTEDPLVDIPVSSIRDQKETGNCWLYATTSWVESIELAALREKQDASTVKAPPPLSIAYFDYWDCTQPSRAATSRARSRRRSARTSSTRADRGVRPWSSSRGAGSCAPLTSAAAPAS